MAKAPIKHSIGSLSLNVVYISFTRQIEKEKMLIKSPDNYVLVWGDEVM